MTKDRLFVIILVMLIPMTGCFGAVDNADAEENEGDTIVNNYYYNNTTSVVTPQVEMFSAGGMLTNNMSNSGEIDTYTYSDLLGGLNYGAIGYFHPFSFETKAGEAVKIHYISVIGNISSWNFVSECEDNSTWSIGTIDMYMGGSHLDCLHTFKIAVEKKVDQTWDVENPPNYYSLIYSIESVTVV